MQRKTPGMLRPESMGGGRRKRPGLFPNSNGCKSPSQHKPAQLGKDPERPLLPSPGRRLGAFSTLDNGTVARPYQACREGPRWGAPDTPPPRPRDEEQPPPRPAHLSG